VCSGALLARIAADGGETSVITCTDGGAATIFGEGMATEENYRNQATIRRGEWNQALDHLRVGRRQMLPYQDSGMAGDPTNEAPGSFHTANLDDAVRRVVREIREFRPQVMVTYPPDGGYGHPDHIKAYQVTMAAVEAAADPARYPEEGRPWQVSSVQWSGLARSTAQAVRSLCVASDVEDPFTAEAHSAYWTRALPDRTFDAKVDARDIWAEMVKPAVEAHRTQMPQSWPMLALPAAKGAQALASSTSPWGDNSSPPRRSSSASSNPVSRRSRRSGMPLSWLLFNSGVPLRARRAPGRSPLVSRSPDLNNGHVIVGRRLRHRGKGVACGAMTPPRDDPPRSGDERTMLIAWLEFHRDTLRLKCDGLTAEQVGLRSAPPSTLSLHGLVRHLAEVEQHWFRVGLEGETIEPLFYTEAEPDGDFDHTEPEHWEADRAYWESQCELARNVVSSLDLDALSPEPDSRGRHFSMRWVLIHMIEEYARHNGHADLLRQGIDGATGA